MPNQATNLQGPMFLVQGPRIQTGKRCPLCNLDQVPILHYGSESHNLESVKSVFQFLVHDDAAQQWRDESPLTNADSRFE